jgi:ribosomal protein S18 acetylase RimI-like enzyme
MDLDLPSGVRARTGVRSDAGPINNLVAAWEQFHDGMFETHLTDIEHAFAMAGEDGGVVVVEAGDRLVGWATLWGDRVQATVHPEWAGRGIGTALLRWGEARARTTGAPRVRQIVTDNDAGAHRLFAANGYERTDTAWILELPLAADAPEVEVPAGVTLRPYDPAHARATYRLIEDAFNEWRGREPQAFEAWAAHVVDHESFSPTMSWLAFDGEELVGAALNYDYEGSDEGWVDQVATKATHRHRGIGRALLQASFAAFHGAGQRTVGLSTNSRTGALSLYERIGMRIRRSYTAWEKAIA